MAAIHSKARNGQPDLVCPPRHADEMMRRDIGGDHRSADDPPRKISAGEEIIVGRLLLARDDQSHGGDDGQINEKNDQVVVHGGRIQSVY